MIQGRQGVRSFLVEGQEATDAEQERGGERGSPSDPAKPLGGDTLFLFRWLFG
uniref:Uncharacterized protein n=1 Tax=Nelumbo nucifera TaxID=4432 RepID=A0A822Z774_NELNU|nr:TPA_asm: hypothetical protein HUJ06_014736 [Nelumbo nucifera]